jgi:hypothetical protein
MGPAAVAVGDGVVEVAVHGRVITARGPTRQIAAPHVVGKPVGGDVARFGRIRRRDQRCSRTLAASSATICAGIRPSVPTTTPGVVPWPSTVA